MADYSNFLSLANRLISKKGMEITYLHITEVDDFFDPVTGKYPVQIEKKEVMGVKTSPTKEELERGQFQGIKLVILVAGDNIENPDTTDMIQFGGHDYDIKEIVTVSPAEDNILYKFGVEDMGLSGDNTESLIAQKAKEKASHVRKS